MMKIESTQWSHATIKYASFVHQEVQQPIATCMNYDFSVCNYSFTNKIDILH